MGVRDQIRAATVGAPLDFQPEIVTVNGAEVELRLPTVGKRAAISRASQSFIGIGEDARAVVNMARFQVEAVIACCFEPGTDTAVYDAADVDALLAQPTGGWFEDLQNAVMRKINGARLGKPLATTAPSKT